MSQLQPHLEYAQSKSEFEDPIQTLKWVVERFELDEIIMGTGFGAPGVALLDMLMKVNNNIKVFYIDTGFLFNETYELKSKLESHYNMKFERLTTSLLPEDQTQLYGEALWERDTNLCCNIRKVLPLKKALKNYNVWITGIRRAQTEFRHDAHVIEYDDRFDISKVNPLINYTHNQVWDYIHKNNLPYNELHDKGYPSLGCIQCTTSVKNGEDDRAGRWRGSNKSECGLHFSQENGKVKIIKPEIN